MKLKVRAVICLLLTFHFLTIMYGQDAPGEVTRTYAISNVHIHTSPGNVIENGTIVIKDGLIYSVGKSKDKDPGNPTNERAGITPEKSIATMLKPSDKSVSDFRSVGFTASHSVPHGRMMPGMGSIILLDGEDEAEMVYKADVSSFGQFKGGQGVFPNTVIAVMTKWRELYKQSQQASNHISKYAANTAGMTRPKYDAATMGLIPVTKKQKRMYVSAPDHLDIYRVMGLQRDLGFQLALVNVKNGYRLADKIKGSNTPVLLSLDLFKEEKEDDKKTKEPKNEWEVEIADFNKKKKAEQEKIMGQAALFAQKGISFGFSSDGVNGKKAMENVRRYIKAGLSEKDALAALTTNPAQMLGVSNAMGTLQNGKIANVIISKGPIFDEKSKVRYVFVDGNLHEYEEKKKAKKKGSSGEVSEENKAFVGTWEFPLSIQGQNMKGEMTINQNDDGDLNGTLFVTGTEETIEIEKIEVDGKTISYTAEVDGIEISWSGTAEGETMNGTLVAGPFGTFEVEATRTSGPDQF